MAMRSIISSSGLRHIMQGSGRSPSIPVTVSGLRRFSDQGRVLSEEERAKETVYIQKMEKERMEKMKLKAEKEKAEKDKKGEEAAQKS